MLHILRLGLVRAVRDEGPAWALAAGRRRVDGIGRRTALVLRTALHLLFSRCQSTLCLQAGTMGVHGAAGMRRAHPNGGPRGDQRDLHDRSNWGARASPTSVLAEVLVIPATAVVVMLVVLRASWHADDRVLGSRVCHVGRGRAG